MANWFCSVMCRKRLFSPRCRSELIDSAWVVIVPGQKCINKKKEKRICLTSVYLSWLSNYNTIKEFLPVKRVIFLSCINISNLISIFAQICRFDAACISFYDFIALHMRRIFEFRLYVWCHSTANWSICLIFCFSVCSFYRRSSSNYFVCRFGAASI